MRLWQSIESKDQRQVTTKFFEGLSSLSDLSLVSQLCQTFIDYIELPRLQYLQSGAPVFNFDLTEAKLSQALHSQSYLNKELLIYLVYRDSRLHDQRLELTKLQLTQTTQRPVSIRFFLAQILEKHAIAVINLMKDIQAANSDIYLTLKTMLRALGLYNEEFSIQSMIYRSDNESQQREELIKYKQLDKADIVKIIQGAAQGPALLQ